MNTSTIHSESLQNLLASLRQLSSPLPPIPALPALHRGDVIEIQGPASSGKTHLLYHLLLCLLARPQIAAVVYDTDAAFDIQRFRHLLLSRSSTPDPHDAVRQTLARLHVFRPASLVQLAASIAHLPAYHSSRLPNQEIAVLAIDSISSFHWADRFSAEQLRNASPAMDRSVPMPRPLRLVLDAIQSFRRSHRPLVILTNWALTDSVPSRSESSCRQHLRPFPVLDDAIADLGAKAPTDPSLFRLSHRITLPSPPPDPSPLDHAPLRHRSHAVGNRPVHGLIQSSGARDAVSFGFQITNDDVLTCERTRCIGF